MAAQPSMIFPVPKPPANAQISPNPRRFRYQQNASSLSDAEISSTQQASTAAVPSPVSVDEQVPTLSEPTASGSVAHWRSMRKQAQERETRPLNAPVEFVPLEDGRIWCQNLHDNNGYMVSLDTPLSRSSSLSSLPAETPRSNSALHMRDMLMGDEDLENFLTQDEEEQPQRPQRKSDSAQLLQSMLRLGPMRQDCMEFSSGLLRNLEDNLEVTNQADSSGSETDTVPASSTSAAHMRYYLANLLGDETLAGS
mmetsp:Transcript_28793/g.52196  ORF Transcript_28793/g.52196 Transcript_28793/m.52196 type:complete len:253 (+) Transcript_28793:37-795(+)